MSVIKSFATILKDNKSVKEQSDFFSILRPVSLENPLPTNFDGRSVWKDFLCPIGDQRHCGNCWAFASSSVLSDRYAQFYLLLILQHAHINLPMIM